MKIAFVSNYFNHHQRPLSEALYRLTDGCYRFIATMEMTQERKDMGYSQDLQPEYLILSHRSEEAWREAADWICSADLVIAGSAPERMLAARKREGKLIFRYSERPLKNGPQPMRYLLRLVRWHMRNPLGKPIYMLSASAYAAGDYGDYGLFPGKIYRWGYFPETRLYPQPEQLLAQKDAALILWCGRFLDWKHPDDALWVAKRLKEDGHQFRMILIGTGQLHEELIRMIRQFQLEDCVLLAGAMKPEQVREHMERSGIYLFTSDRKEGWGAVLNEAMNSGCAVIAGHAAGATPFLVEDGVNGWVFRSGDREMLYEKTAALLKAPDLQAALGRNAYSTITTQWNADIAAERMISLASRILAGERSPVLYREGPCSPAARIRDYWR